jgi:choline dehydrogenase-like flavoprotein
MIADVIVVGSGPGGVNAATPLVEAGRQVLMLDFGNRDDHYSSLIPPLPFTELRHTDDEQHRYFLGDRFEGLPGGKLRVGVQLTPPRQYVHADTAHWLPIISEHFSAMQSLARGGLGNAWGAGVFPFSADELKRMHLDAADLQPHYEAVAERIGISGARDDLLPFLGDCRAMMPPLEIDSNAQRLLDRYQANRRYFQARRFFLGQTRVAVCTRSHRGRGPHAYQDMDFWADSDRSVYRARWTVDELQGRSNFTYADRRLVLAFRDMGDMGKSGDMVEVEARHADTGERQLFRARYLILAAGTLSTTRIVLRSLNRYDVRVPILCNPYTYVPVLNIGMLGQAARDRRHSLAQVTGLYCPANGDVVQSQFYSYRSLLAFKLLKEVPLGCRNALGVLRVLMNALGILGINHADTRTPYKCCRLVRGEFDGPDSLHIDYELSAQEQRNHAVQERAVLRLFRQLGCWGLKRIHPGHGSSIHYAGSLPISVSDDGSGLSCDTHCRLRATRNVYLADGSVFPYLPAKGLTFSLMANADRVAKHVAHELGSSRRSQAA